MIVRLLKDVIDLGVGAFGLFVLVLLAVAFEFGFQVGRRRLARRPPPANEAAGVSTLITGMLGLMPFTLALTISFAQDRFETRRHTTLAEANTIGTAWLGTGLAGAPGKPIAALIEDYARARLAYLEAPTSDTAAASIARTNALRTRIWQGTLPPLEGMPAPLGGRIREFAQRHVQRQPGAALCIREPSAHRDRTDAPGRRHARRRRSRLPDRSRGATAAAAGRALARNAERRDGRDRRPQPATARIPPSRLGASGLDHPRFCAYFAMTMRADLRLFTNGRNEL